MGKKEDREKKKQKELAEKAKEQKKPKKEVKPNDETPKTPRKRSFRQLRAEFNALCKAGNFQRAWEISKLYHRRWFRKHR